jgi:ribonuclease P protein component
VLTHPVVQLRYACFRVYSTPNGEATARLGLIVGKRQLRRAIDRNRLKRVLRETFRLRRVVLPAVDVLVQLVAAPPDRGLSDRANAMWLELIRTMGKENDERRIQ